MEYSYLRLVEQRKERKGKPMGNVGRDAGRSRKVEVGFEGVFNVRTREEECSEKYSRSRKVYSLINRGNIGRKYIWKAYCFFFFFFLDFF